MKKLLTFLLSGFTTAFTFQTSIAQNSSWEQDAMKPFWKGNLMRNESVLMIQKEGQQPEATLLFKPKRIISVQNAALDTTYRKGKDWQYKHGKLQLLPNSKAAYMTTKELYPDSARFRKKDGGFVFHTEGTFFHQQQLAVTYKHRRKAWKGLVHTYQSTQLPNSTERLQQKKKLHLLLFGDSISAGANASKSGKAAPYLPSYGELVANHLQRYYQTEIQFTNTSVGGKTTNWGVETVQDNVVAHNPDLVIIAFGMNDGTGKMSPQKFKDNIASIMQQTRAANPACEFILVAPMLPNPESTFLGTQPAFKAILDELVTNGVTVVDMTSVHRTLLETKSYQDLTGNNINHPNDFLMRWYAQQIVSTLLPNN